MANTFGFDEFEEACRRLFEETPNEIENFLGTFADEAVGDTQLNTPVLSGDLRRSWGRSDIVNVGNSFSVEVGTNIDYAEAVEYGHKTKNGGFVKGRFVLTNVIKKKEKELPKRLEELINKMTGELKL